MILRRKEVVALLLSFLVVTNACQRRSLVRGERKKEQDIRRLDHDCDEDDSRGKKSNEQNTYWTYPPTSGPTPRPSPFYWSYPPTRRPTPGPTPAGATSEPTPMPVAAGATPEPTPSSDDEPTTMEDEPTATPGTGGEPTASDGAPTGEPPTTTEDEPTATPGDGGEPTASGNAPTEEPPTTMENEPTATPGNGEEPTPSDGAPTGEPTDAPGDGGEPTTGTTTGDGSTTAPPVSDTTGEEETPYETIGNVTDDSGIESKCRVAPSSPPALSTVVSFTYEVKVNEGANAEEVLAAIEEATHELLAEELLDCVFPSETRNRVLQTGIPYVAVTSAPRDVAFTPDDTVCLDVADDEDCYNARGGLTAIHLPYEPESDIVDEISTILTDNQGFLASAHPDLRGVSFKSFDGETTTIDDDDDDDPDDPNGANSDPFQDDSGPSRGVVAGGVIIAVTALAIAIAALLLVRRSRRNRAAAVVRPVANDKSILLDDESTGSSSDGFKAVFVNDDKSDSESTSPQNRTAETAMDMSYYEQDYSHDPDTCVIPGCEFCQEHALSQGPQFVNIGNSMHVSLADLSMSSRIPPAAASDRAYAMDDTVAL